MAIFQYTALDSKGTKTSGSIDASSDTEAISKLRSQGFYPTEIIKQGDKGFSLNKKVKTKTKLQKKTQSKSKTTKGKIKPKSLMIFTRQLATLIDAGLPLLKGLTVLEKQEPNQALKSSIGTLSDSVQSGNTFSESLSGHPKIFSKLYINMVKAGELGGMMEVVLSKLADYQEKAFKLKNKIVAAMVYPVIVMFISFAIVVFLLTWIVPKFRKIFIDMLGSEEKLPGITKFVVSLSKNMVEYWYYEVGIIILIVVGWSLLKAAKSGRRFIDKTKLRMPLFGDLQRKSAISRFTRTLGTLVTSGVPILQALNITRETAENVIISESIQKIHNAVKEGDSIVTPMEASGVFPPMVISMVDVGEETGQLPEMLLKVAEVYDDEVDNAVDALTSILEPIMIVFLALIVGVIVGALFMPLVKIIQELGNQ